MRPTIMVEPKHLSTQELEAGLDQIRRAPKDTGVLELIVRRPQIDEREVIEEGKLDPAQGLVGDNWKTRGSNRMADKSMPHPDMQITVMNARVISLLAQDKNLWQLAGDQLFIDMDLSADNLPPGTQLAIGAAVIEVTDQPHTGCKKFMARYGEDALKFVNSPLGKELRMRGVNTKVVKAGVIRVRGVVKKI